MSHPLVHEINTRCWLRDLSERHGRPLNLTQVPDDELRRWQELGLTHVWLMGTWTVGPRSREDALRSTTLREQLDRILPGWQPADVAGSPYAPSDYKVPRALGGEKGLQLFRQQLHARGMKLLLDFVPNHTGLDHRWLFEHPEFYVRSTQPNPGTFEQETAAGTFWIAHGKDPNFPPWTDTAQLDFRRPETQRAVADALQSVARRCDGVRCDMAMLLLRDIFDAQWSHLPAPEPRAEGEFWTHTIRRLKRSQPDLIFLAEVYWDLEAQLQSLGFDYTYDKRLYDFLTGHDPTAVRRHLVNAGPRFLAAGAHFIENHDEQRAAARFASADHRSAALLTLGLPGLRLLHEGQLSGARTFIPIQLARRPIDPVDHDLAAFYDHLLRTLRNTAVGVGHPAILPNRPAWPGNNSHECLVACQWQAAADAFDLVVVNLASHRSQAYVELAVEGVENRNWHMQDLLGPEHYVRTGDDLRNQGLYLDVAGHAAQLFHFSHAN